MRARGVESLARIRGLRNRPERDLTIGAAVDQVEREVKKLQKATGGVGAAWEELAPANLAGKCRVVGISRGTLTVRVPDAATRYEVDRFLRSGGEAALAARGRVSIKRVKIVL